MDCRLTVERYRKCQVDLDLRYLQERELEDIQLVVLGCRH